MAWDIVYYDPDDKSTSAVAFLDACPTNVESKLLAVLDAVANAPPPQFSGGGMWEAMHGDMGGYYEVRTAGPNRELFRLFCILENADVGDEQYDRCMFLCEDLLGRCPQRQVGGGAARCRAEDDQLIVVAPRFA